MPGIWFLWSKKKCYYFSKRKGKYTHAHLWFPPLFLAVNHHNNKNWVPSTLTCNLWLIFMGMKQKKIQNGRLKKTEFFNFVKSWANSAKISWIRPWVSRIEWCEGHWFCSTYMAVRLSDICSKTGKKHKKCIFCLFWSMCQTASRPYRLSKINALRIIQSY